MAIKKHTIGIIALFIGIFLLRPMIEDKVSLFLSVGIRTILSAILIIFGLMELNKL